MDNDKYYLKLKINKKTPCRASVHYASSGRKIKHLKKDDEVVLKEVFINCYGRFYTVKKDNKTYDIEREDFEIVEVSDRVISAIKRLYDSSVIYLTKEDFNSLVTLGILGRSYNRETYFGSEVIEFCL